MYDRLHFFLNRLLERLWVKPLLICLLSIAGVFLAKALDDSLLTRLLPQISTRSIDTLLDTMAASMLVIATFAVGSMVAAYASAGNNSTPRTFPLVLADDVSQNAFSAFIGAFIYSIVALIALKNGYFEGNDRFALFSLTLGVFALVILTFVRWVDRIARLGRLGTTIDKVEQVTHRALQRRRRAPTLRALAADSPSPEGIPIQGAIGYVQWVDVAALQRQAEKAQLRIQVLALPGTFSLPGMPLALYSADNGDSEAIDPAALERAFVIGRERKFDADPRFGLIVLSEIASRALSPAVNDPGTAIDIVGRMVRLFALWAEPLEPAEPDSPFDRVSVPALSPWDLCDDAFSAIERDGAGTLEVLIRLQKAFQALAALGEPQLAQVARHHARKTLARAEAVLTLEEDRQRLRDLASFAREN